MHTTLIEEQNPTLTQLLFVLAVTLSVGGLGLAAGLSYSQGRFSKGILAVLDRMYEGILLTILFMIPLSYSVGFTTTLLIKETQTQTLVLLLLGVWTARGLLRGKAAYARTPYNVGLWTIYAWAVLSLFWAEGGTRTSIRDLSLFGSFLVIFLLLTERMRDRMFRSKAILVVFVTGFLVASLCLLQFTRQTDFLIQKYGGYKILGVEIPEVRPLGSFAGVYLDPQGRPRTDHGASRTSIASTIGHNISVATYIMVIGFLALGSLLTGRFSTAKLSRSGNRPACVRVCPLLWRSLGRGAVPGGLALTLCALLILVSETRAVYIVFPLGLLSVLGLLLAIPKGEKNGRYENRYAKSATARMTMLLLLGGLIVCATGFYLDQSGKADIQARLATLRNPLTLLRGTRVRLWTISLKMIRDYPVTGTGFATFKYRYPEYQGRFFSENPDTELRPTDFHTDRVHNEYLQIPVELGPVGMFLIFYLLAVHVCYLARVLRKKPEDPEHRKRMVYQAVLGAVTFAIFLDALTSFYFHVIVDALMATIVFSLLIGLSPRTPVREVSFGVPSRTSSARFACATGVLVLAILLGFFGPGLFTWFLRTDTLASLRGPVAHALGDRVFLYATMEYGRIEQNEAALRRSFRRNTEADLPLKTQEDIERAYLGVIAKLEKAHSLASHRGSIQRHEAFPHFKLAWVNKALAQAVGASDGEKEVAKEHLERAVFHAEAARDSVHEALNEYRYFHMYAFLSGTESLLADLYGMRLAAEGDSVEPSEREMRSTEIEALKESSLKNLDMACRIYPLNDNMLDRFMDEALRREEVGYVLKGLDRYAMRDRMRDRAEVGKMVYLDQRAGFSIAALNLARGIRFRGDKEYWNDLLDLALSAKTGDPTALERVAKKAQGTALKERSDYGYFGEIKNLVVNLQRSDPEVFKTTLLAKIGRTPLEEDEKPWASLIQKAWKSPDRSEFRNVVGAARQARLAGDPERAEDVLERNRRGLEQDLSTLRTAYRIAVKERPVEEVLWRGYILFESERFLGNDNRAEKIALEVLDVADEHPGAANIFVDYCYPDRLDLFESRLYEDLAALDDGRMNSALFFRFNLLAYTYGLKRDRDGAVGVWERLEDYPRLGVFLPWILVQKSRALWLADRPVESLEAAKETALVLSEQPEAIREELAPEVQRLLEPLLLPALEM